MGRFRIRRVVIRGLLVVGTVGLVGHASPVRADGTVDDLISLGSRPLAVAVDLAVVRPFSILRIGIGGAFFVLSSPFLLPDLVVSGARHGKLAESYEFYLGEPVEYLKRPLGEFD